MVVKAVLIALAVWSFTALSAGGAEAKSLTLATWNIEHLTADGTGCVRRTEEDYQAIRDHIARLEADIVAFQEVASLAAAQRIFPQELWDIHIAAPSTPWPAIPCAENDDEHLRPQLTGFAVRKNRITVISGRQIDAFERPYTKQMGDNTYTGATPKAYELVISVSGLEIALLALHLHPYCFEQGPDGGPECEIFFSQGEALNSWVEAQARAQRPFILMGDFNRRFDAASGDLWNRLSDGKPTNARLWRPTEHRTQPASCWYKMDGYIDHIVFDRLSRHFYVANSFHPLPWTGDKTRKVSDHCPLRLRLRVPERPSDAAQWFSASSEMRIFLDLVTQTAHRRLIEIAAERAEADPPGRPWAVSFDIDETVLSNVWFKSTADRYGIGFDAERWTYWVNQARAPALPGMLALMQHVLDLGGRVVLITNRQAYSEDATWNNLEKVWAASDQTRGALDPARICLIGQSAADHLSAAEHKQAGLNDKDRRRILFMTEAPSLCDERLTEAPQGPSPWAGPIDIVMYLGDKVEDFPCVRQADLWPKLKKGRSLSDIPVTCRSPRLAQSLGKDSSFADHLWKEFFLIPNPMYGTWQNNTP